MSHRASERRRCTPPSNSGGTTTLPPHQRRRGDELVHICQTAALLPVFWALRDPQAMREATAVSVLILPDALRLAILEEIEQEETETEGGDGDGGLVVAMLMATRWFVQLELPFSESELWSGPPLLLRLPLIVTITARQNDALHSFVFDCLSGIGETGAAATAVEDLSSDDLRQVLEVLDGGPGGGAVDLRTLRMFDSRRVFERLRQRAEAAHPATEITRLAAEAAAKIRRAIDDRSPVAAVATELQPEVQARLQERWDDDGFLDRLILKLGDDKKEIDDLRGAADSAPSGRRWERLRMSFPELPQKDEDLLPPLGAAITAVREQSGMSVETMAGQIGFDPVQLAGIEAGQIEPTYGDVRRIARGMEVPMEDLMVQVVECEREAWG